MFVVTHFDKHGTKEWLTLGKFASADEAARCYDRHVKATDGTKAKLNFPESAQAPPRAGACVLLCVLVEARRPCDVYVVCTREGGVTLRFCMIFASTRQANDNVSVPAGEKRNRILHPSESRVCGCVRQRGRE